jgi:hypothetical protein
MLSLDGWRRVMMKTGSKQVFIMFVCLYFLLAIFFISIVTGALQQDSYLPMIYKFPYPTPTLSSTFTDIPDNTPTATDIPEPIDTTTPTTTLTPTWTAPPHP